MCIQHCLAEVEASKRHDKAQPDLEVALRQTSRASVVTPAVHIHRVIKSKVTVTKQPTLNLAAVDHFAFKFTLFYRMFQLKWRPNRKHCVLHCSTIFSIVVVAVVAMAWVAVVAAVVVVVAVVVVATVVVVVVVVVVVAVAVVAAMAVVMAAAVAVVVAVAMVAVVVAMVAVVVVAVVVVVVVVVVSKIGSSVM
jgi:hypothetical protein